MKNAIRIFMCVGLLALAFSPGLHAQQSVANLSTQAAACGSPGTTSTAYVVLPVPANASSVGLALSGTWSGTVSFFATVNNGAVWSAFNVNPSASSTAVSTATANGSWTNSPAPYSHICAVFTTASSGTAVVTIGFSPAVAAKNGSGGGSGGSSPVASVNAYTVASSCGTALNCTQARYDGQIALKASYTTGTDTVTTDSSDPVFVPGDVGKIAFAAGTCGDGTAVPCTRDIDTTTITAVTDGHHATVAANFINSSDATPGVFNVFIWGHDDSAAINTAVTAVNADTATSPHVVVLQCGTMLVSSQIFQFGNATTGFHNYPVGVQGCSGGGTTIIPTPNLNCPGQTYSNQSGCLLSQPQDATTGNPYVTTGEAFRDLNFYSPADTLDGTATVGMNVGGMIAVNLFDLVENVTLAGFVRADSHNLFGMIATGSTLVNVEVYSAGNGMGNGFGSKWAGAFNVPLEVVGGLSGRMNSQSSAFIASGSVHTSGFYGNDGTLIEDASTSGQWTDSGSEIGDVTVDDGAFAMLTGSVFRGINPNITNAGTLKMMGTHSRTAEAFLTQSSGSFYDLGGNDNFAIPASTVTGGNVYSGGYVGGGQFTAYTTSYSYSLIVKPTCSVSGAGSGATCTLATNSTPSFGQMQINSGTSPAATGTATLTFPFPYPSASFCTFALAGGSTTLSARATAIQTTLSASAPVVSWDNNAVAIGASQSPAFSISYQCSGT